MSPLISLLFKIEFPNLTSLLDDILKDLPVGGYMEILEQAEPEHELRVFRRPAEVRGISILDQFINKRKIDHLVYLAEQMVLGDNAVIKVTAVERGLGWFGSEHWISPVGGLVCCDYSTTIEVCMT